MSIKLFWRNLTAVVIIISMVANSTGPIAQARAWGASQVAIAKDPPVTASTHDYPPVAMQRVLFTTALTTHGTEGKDNSTSFSQPALTGLTFYEFAPTQVATPTDREKGCAHKKNCDQGKDPVRLDTGEFHLEASDLRLPGRGFDYEFIRAYRSQILYNGPLGWNWDFNHNQWLIQAGTVITHATGFGRDDRYEANGDGTFKSRPGVYMRLTQNQDGSWTLRDPHGTQTNFFAFDGSVTAGKLASIVDRNGNTMTFQYNSQGQMILVSDTKNANVHYRYNAQGRLVEIEDYTGRKVTFEYSPNGDLSAVTRLGNGGGRATRYTYSSGYADARLNHNLLTITAPNETALEPDGPPYLINTYETAPDSYAFDRVIQQQLGGTVTFVYEKLNSGVDPGNLNLPRNRTTITDQNGNVAVYEHNSLGNRVRLEEFTPGGLALAALGSSRVMTYTYNADSELLTTVYPEENEVKHVYDETNPDRLQQANLLEVHQRPDPDRGGGTEVVATYVYEPTYNKVVTETNPLGETTSHAYDEKGNQVAVVDAEKNVTRYGYDEHGQVITTTNALSSTQSTAIVEVQPPILEVTPTSLTFVYPGSSAQAAKVASPGTNLGLAISTASAPSALQAPDPNEFGRVVTTTNALGFQTISRYDARGKLTSVTDANSHTTTYTYDNFGHLTRVTDALGNATTYTYDANANRTSVTDPNGNTTTYVYDILNRLVKIIDPLGNQTTYTYDGNGNRTSVTDANGHTTRYFYDEFDRPVKVQDALGKETQYGYDSNDNLTSITDANGHTTTLKYDGFNRLIEERDPPGHGPTYTYDAAGNLKTRTDALGHTTVYTYNAVNQLTNIDYPDDSDVTFEYDAVGNVKRTTDKNVDIHNTYDALNRLKSASYQPFNKTITYTYDPVGNRATMVDYDGGRTTYEYDHVNRPITLTNPLNQVTTWQYDRAGRLIRKNYHNSTYATYTYTDTNWLIFLANKKSTGAVLSSYSYEYDKIGNRTKMTKADGGETSYRYDNSHQLTGVTYPDATTTQYQYDPVGNRLVMTDTTGTTIYAYDDANRLLTAGTVTYTWDNNGNQTSKVEGGNTTTYTYDYENRLTGMTFPDGSTNRFTYYPGGRRLSATNKAGATTYYFYDGFNTLAETDSSGTTVARYTSGRGIDDWISMDRGAASYYYHRDGLGSVMDLSSISETVVASYNYDAFGTLRSQTGSLVNPYKFTGRELDAESTLYFYRARYYDARAGRFNQKDPLRLWTGKNHFAYVSNNPVNQVDPLGLRRKKPTQEDLIAAAIEIEEEVRRRAGRDVKPPADFQREWELKYGPEETIIRAPYPWEEEETPEERRERERAEQLNEIMENYITNVVEQLFTGFALGF